jgi:DnaK suppressor protein
MALMDGDPGRSEHRQRLLVRLDEIDAQLQRSKDVTTAVVPDAAIGRLTRVDAVQAGYVSDELRRRIAAERIRVERALQRIEDGTYGLCQACKGPIPDARLIARPDAALCVDCAEVAERRRR